MRVSEKSLTVPERAENPERTHLFIRTLFHKYVLRLQFALQHAIVTVLLVDLPPVRVHLQDGAK